MAYTALSHLDDWHLVHPEQDIRGWNVVDGNGASLGRVAELLVDTESELVERVRLDDGAEFSAHEIEIGDGVVHARGAEIAGAALSGASAGLTESRTVPIVSTYRDTRIRRRDGEGLADNVGTRSGTMAGSTVGGTPLATATSGTPLAMPAAYESFENDFRDHHRTTFGAAGHEFGHYEPGYRYGYTSGIGDRYRGRSYDDAEMDLRREYETQHGQGTWDRVRDAVRHAFNRTR